VQCGALGIDWDGYEQSVGDHLTTMLACAFVRNVTSGDLERWDGFESGCKGSYFPDDWVLTEQNL